MRQVSDEGLGRNESLPWCKGYPRLKGWDNLDWATSFYRGSTGEIGYE